ncbi:MAG TPA: alpha/beta fold hydrolase [Pyrinomonadaceae bacterium]|jgi:pimeloyl-ACP methyl ester carboxylesterase|nr:alpha/beta fold hydrolase [Pyrinomonadaceae bacterium]
MLKRYQLLQICAVNCGAVLLALGLLSQQSNAQQTSTSVATISLRPCEVPGAQPDVKEKGLCGTYDVFEDRAAKSGRKIALKILVFPATGNDKSNDPLFYIPGGPGSSATEDAPYIAQQLAAIRERRDLVFVDQRGTGGSNPLNCEFFNQSDLRSYFGYYFPLDDVRKCRAQLEPKANLRLYTTTIAMDDLDDVRNALGYEKINLLGGSYGTRAVQVYLKNHQSHVRAIVLHGVSPTNQFMPRDFPEHTERALNGVLDECNADDACRNAFPQLRDDAKKVLAKLLNGPVAVDLKRPPDGAVVQVELSRDLAGEAIRYMLYQPGAASRIPLFLHLAAQGNFVPLAESALFYRQEIVATGSNGMYLSVTCAEDLPMIKSGEGERNGTNTFLGNYRLRQQRAACALWPQGKIPKNYAEPTRSNVPALILTGQWDPVTPPAYGAAAAKSLPSSLHVVVPHGGHGFGGLNGTECLDKLIVAFINSGSTKELDIACVGSIKRKGFALKLLESN